MLVRTILIRVLLSLRLEPSLHDGFEWRCVQVVQLVLALADCRKQARRFQYFQVLRDCLSRESELMLHGQSCAQLEQRLAVALNQFVENGAACGCRDGLEDIAHG